MLRSSRHLQTIAMVIGFAAIGAAIIEQQLNMAAAQEKGAANVGAVTAFLSQVVAYSRSSASSSRSPLPAASIGNSASASPC